MKIMVNKRFWLGILVMVLAFGMTVVGCDDGNGDSSIAYVAVTDIINVPSMMPFGSPLSLNGTVLPDNATNKTIIWSVKTANNSGAAINGNKLTVTNFGTDWGNIIINASIIKGKTEDTDFSRDFWINIRTYNKMSQTLYFRGAVHDNGTPNWIIAEDLILQDTLTGQLEKNTSYKVVIKGVLDTSLEGLYLNICGNSPEEGEYEWTYLCDGAILEDTISAGTITREFIVKTKNNNDVTRYGNKAFIALWNFQPVAETDIGKMMAKISNFSWTITKLE
ncbi:MAG: hypothetical protein LBB89_11680 [Treponema sp.]|jgi:hypothetical protein|nr:hypothetical protein [Treponema sp.]